MEKKSVKEKSHRYSSILGTIAIILLILIIIVVIWLLIVNTFSCDSDCRERDYCAQAKIRIIGANAENNSITLNRMAGSPEVSVVDFKIMVNEEVKNIISVSYGDNSLMVLERKTYAIDYDLQTGDNIKVAPVIEAYGSKKFTCKINIEATAV